VAGVGANWPMVPQIAMKHSGTIANRQKRICKATLMNKHVVSGCPMNKSLHFIRIIPMANTDHRNQLIAVYMKARANGNNPAMIAFKERIINDLVELKSALAEYGVTEQQLDAMWEARRKGERK
jgi:hypothetical protein